MLRAKLGTARDLALKVPSPSVRHFPRRLLLRLGPFRPHPRREHRRRVAFYSRFIRPADLCFDIGANVGNRVAAFHALGAKVVAVEPQDPCLAVLARRYGWSDRVAILPAGLADREGAGILRVAAFDQISSMSSAWIDAVRTTGRFGTESWPEQRVIRLTTLDCLIEEFGAPRFCKIDVEGSELEVLKGLSTALPSLSFEFTPEYLAAGLACVAHLETLGVYEYNYSKEESMTLALPTWADADGIAQALSALPGGPPLFGDVYARLRAASGWGEGIS